jgi:hypothetical protein
MFVGGIARLVVVVPTSEHAMWLQLQQLMMVPVLTPKIPHEIALVSVLWILIVQEFVEDLQSKITVEFVKVMAVHALGAIVRIM